MAQRIANIINCANDWRKTRTAPVIEGSAADVNEFGYVEELEAFQEIAELDVLRACHEHRHALRSEAAWY